MKNRVPRKKKKLAKKRKAIADILTTTQMALIAANSAVQLAIVNATPTLGPSPINRILKVLRVIEIAKDSAKLIQERSSQFKDWRNFVHGNKS